MKKIDSIFGNTILFLVAVEIIALCFESIGLASIAVIAMGTACVMWKMVRAAEFAERRKAARMRSGARCERG